MQLKGKWILSEGMTDYLIAKQISREYTQIVHDTCTDNILIEMKDWQFIE